VLKAMCKAEGLIGGGLEWHLRHTISNALMLYFWCGPLPPLTYTLLELKAKTVVALSALRSICSMVGCPLRWSPEAGSIGSMDCAFWALPGCQCEEWWYQCRGRGKFRCGNHVVAKGSDFRLAKVPAHQLLLRFEGLRRVQLQRLASSDFTS
jgi:hypothetical protein